MSKQAVSIGYGKISFSDASASLSAFLIEPPFVRRLPSSDGTGFTVRGKIQMFPATNFPDVNGKLFSSTLDAPDGATLLLQCQRRFNAVPIRDGGVFLRLRSTGPMYTVSADLPPARDSLLGNSFLVFQGRGDLIDVEELEGEGFEFTKNWKNAFLDPEEVAQCFDIRELAPQVEDRPRLEKVTNLSGETVSIRVSKPGRRIRVR